MCAFRERYRKKSRFWSKRLAKDCPNTRKGLPERSQRINDTFARSLYFSAILQGLEDERCRVYLSQNEKVYILSINLIAIIDEQVSRFARHTLLNQIKDSISPLVEICKTWQEKKKQAVQKSSRDNYNSRQALALTEARKSFGILCDSALELDGLHFLVFFLMNSRTSESNDV